MKENERVEPDDSMKIEVRIVEGLEKFFWMYLLPCKTRLEEYGINNLPSWLQDRVGVEIGSRNFDRYEVWSSAKDANMLLGILTNDSGEEIVTIGQFGDDWIVNSHSVIFVSRLLGWYFNLSGMAKSAVNIVLILALVVIVDVSAAVGDNAAVVVTASFIVLVASKLLRWLFDH